MSTNKRAPMARWLKITIVVVILGLLSTVGLIVVGAKFLFDSTKKALEPEQVARVSDSIVKMKEPLPRGFTRVLAADIMGTAEVVFSNSRANLGIMFLKGDQTKRQLTASDVVEDFVRSGGAEQRTILGEMMGANMTIVLRDRMTVGGEEMPYAIGERVMNGRKVSQLVGCVMPRGTTRPIIIIAQSKVSEKFDLELTKQFLAAVKSF